MLIYKHKTHNSKLLEECINWILSSDLCQHVRFLQLEIADIKRLQCHKFGPCLFNISGWSVMLEILDHFCYPKEGQMQK